ncbi:glycosyltransferase involved in cell wall biosynthesis [Flavobacterium sp. CG_23.5]|uniref:glycosyltransferase family 2 protein n=1 Tax=unclassified Flavobacterium TaxID=196869 RepID=UPI0018CA366E|nr:MULTISPECIES: glycosyltransferase family 2 protein [unclassified Flavobacterium]MBG6109880.1 glycosyltransferase involved in cell wall biosynthesis [Flavobacterium sp. CG_9.10]MBP2283122.1 glycosyltransferase involved in cell wall biosynthesis [Flavobacterium sp. CG_23.5]
MPKISIITCTWNSEKYLEECLLSIKNQTFKDYEIIIVDGGSVDQTLDIIKKYNIEKVFTNIRGGVSKAMNFGISHASGDIIAILHSDDYYYSNNSLDLVASCFVNTNCEWLYGSLVRKKRNGEFIFQKNLPYSKEFLSYTFNIPHPTVFVKKAIYEKIGYFDEKYKYAMDYDLILRIAKKYTPFQINENITVFREHNDSLSTSNWSKAQIESLLIQQKHAENWSIKAKGLFRFLKTRLARMKNKLK